LDSTGRQRKTMACTGASTAGSKTDEDTQLPTALITAFGLLPNLRHDSI